MNQISVTEARKNFDRLVESNRSTILIKNNSPVASILPYAFYEELMTAYREKQYRISIELANIHLEEKSKTLTNEELGELLKRDSMEIMKTKLL